MLPAPRPLSHPPTHPQIVRAAYPDPTQFDPASERYDAKADPDEPRWVAVDCRFVRKLAAPVYLEKLKVRVGGWVGA